VSINCTVTSSIRNHATGQQNTDMVPIMTPNVHLFPLLHGLFAAVSEWRETFRRDRKMLSGRDRTEILFMVHDPCRIRYVLTS
jgi:hypothetical protein